MKDIVIGGNFEPTITLEIIAQIICNDDRPERTLEQIKRLPEMAALIDAEYMRRLS